MTRNPATRSKGKQCSARKDALKRLGLADPPRINPLSLTAVQAAGSKKAFIEYARAADVPEVQALVEKWDSLSPSDRRALAITDLCEACEVEFSQLLGAVTAAAFEHNTDVSKLIAAVNQPKVVKATIESAVKFIGPDGVKDRQMLHTHSNFVPVPKSATTIFRLQQQINNTREIGEGQEPSGLPSFENDTIRFNSAQRGKLLPATIDAPE